MQLTLKNAILRKKIMDSFFPFVLNKIGFTQRYQAICAKHNDFDNSMSGNQKEQYDRILNQLGYKAKYFKKETFYRIVSINGDYEFTLQLVLKDGIVESMLNVKKGENYFSPYGRFDFIPQKMNVEFDRKLYNLPKYKSLEELEEILKEIFSIFEDIKKELMNQYHT